MCDFNSHIFKIYTSKSISAYSTSAATFSSVVTSVSCFGATVLGKISSLSISTPINSNLLGKTFGNWDGSLFHFLYLVLKECKILL